MRSNCVHHIPEQFVVRDDGGLRKWECEVAALAHVMNNLAVYGTSVANATNEHYAL